MVMMMLRAAGVMALSKGLRGRFATARVIVAAQDACALVDAVTRMGVANVSQVDSMEVAQALCDKGDIDACLVVLPRASPDERPAWTAESAAPGRGRVPALLLAEPVTPYVKRCARAAGYAAAIPLGLSSRLLYRAIGALLQASGRRAGRPRHVARTGAVRSIADPAGVGKPRLQ